MDAIKKSERTEEEGGIMVTDALPPPKPLPLPEQTTFSSLKDFIE